jgi:hypothetical protein
LGTGAKIAIGCALALVLAVVVAVVGLGGLAYWGISKGKDKLEQVAGEEQRIEELQKKADRNAFTRPADGVIAEDRLVKFLDVRKGVYDVYQKHAADLESRSRKDKAELSDVTTAFTVVNEIRLAQAQALADTGMSQDEYRWLVEQVYKTMLASEVERSTGTASVSEAASQAMGKAMKEMARADAEAKTAAEAARRAGSVEGQTAAAESREAMAKGMEDLEKAQDQMREQAKQMDVPAANLALFRKYEADIKRYAMTGLAWVGL